MRKIEDILNLVRRENFSAFFYTPPSYRDAKSYLFRHPVHSLVAEDETGFADALRSLDALINQGLAGYGLISYEAGYLLEDRLNRFFRKAPGFPLLAFLFFNKDDVLIGPSADIDFSSCRDILAAPNFQLSDLSFSTSPDRYAAHINQIKALISQGETYQVNYTIRGHFDFEGDPGPFFLQLLFNQSAEYSAFINLGDDYVISLSPELFFRLEDSALITRPMKGTIDRGANPDADRRQRERLKSSPKDRAENLMIVDLLRNDMARCSEPGSVKVLSLFDIERYESLFQMTSTVASTVRDKTISPIIRHMFPCGSVTGAPKIRTMEIIHSLENEPRGLYTGAIGLFDDRKTVFNVAIRTLRIPKNGGRGEIGLGGGIVWDSDAEKEYEEAVLKGRFLTGRQEYFEIFETLLIENNVVFLDSFHKERMSRAADYFLFAFEEAQYQKTIRRSIEKCRPDRRYRLKLRLDKWGRFRTQIQECRPLPPRISVVLSPSRVDAGNPFLYFKTTRRELYDKEQRTFSKKGFFEVLYLNQDLELTEGSFTNIFLEINGRLYTPPLECGLLDGGYRDFLLKKKTAYEKKLTLKDLRSSGKMILTNSVRKEILVDDVSQEGIVIKTYNGASFPTS